MSGQPGRRPRAQCPACGRSTAGTFNAVTGEAYLRSHNRDDSKRIWGKAVSCLMSRRVVPRGGVR